MKKSKLVLYGCGGHARSIINTVRELYEKIEVILVDNHAKDNEIIMDCKVERKYELDENDSYFVAIGDNDQREKLYQILHEKNKGRCISIISRHSNIGIDARIGEGTFVASGAYIGPQAVIGNNTIVNTGSVVEHEVRIGDNTHVAPHATICGRSKVGNNVFCGAGSVIINNIEICDDVIIGAGTVVKENIIEAGTYVGVPAKKIK